MYDGQFLVVHTLPADRIEYSTFTACPSGYYDESELHGPSCQRCGPYSYATSFLEQQCRSCSEVGEIETKTGQNVIVNMCSEQEMLTTSDLSSNHSTQMVIIICAIASIIVVIIVLIIICALKDR